MRRAFRVRDVRAAEQATGALLTGGVLMQRAAAALAVVAADLLGSVYGARVVLLVGSGGNGGDALFAGARLARRGARVDAVLLSPTAHAEGLADLRRANGRVVAADDPTAPLLVAAADLVVDGITGIGATEGLRPSAVALIDLVPASAQVLAVDLPSGIDADAGTSLGASVVADVTVTFGALKVGAFVDPAASSVGQVVLADIGLDPYLPRVAAAELLEADDVVGLLRRPRTTDDKYARGVVGVAAGSDTYAGAGALTVAGAAATGAGMVRFVGVPAVAAIVRAEHPEAIVTELAEGAAWAEVGRVQSWVVGPGGGTDEHAVEVLRGALESFVPVVVDADGLTLLADHDDLAALVRTRAASTVLTPHAGELARLLGLERADVEARRLATAVTAARTFGATVLLKGSTTVVAAEVGAETSAAPVRINPRATPWLATAGAGDVLAGVIGTLLASGLDAVDAASVGAWLHAAAAELASQGGPVRARDVAAVLPDVVASLLEPVAEGDSSL